MSDFTIEQVLFASVKQLKQDLGFGVVPMEMPNTDLEAYPKLWLKVNNMRAETNPVTLGVHGQDNYSGFLQIDINLPSGGGAGDILKIAQAIKQHYRAGLSIYPVTVSRSSVSSGRLVGSWYRVSVTVYYYSRINRLVNPLVNQFGSLMNDQILQNEGPLYVN